MPNDLTQVVVRHVNRLMAQDVDQRIEQLKIVVRAIYGAQGAKVDF